MAQALRSVFCLVPPGEQGIASTGQERGRAEKQVQEKGSGSGSGSKEVPGMH